MSMVSLVIMKIYLTCTKNIDYILDTYDNISVTSEYEMLDLSTMWDNVVG